jgi:hypothetical protein
MSNDVGFLRLRQKLRYIGLVIMSLPVTMAMRIHNLWSCVSLRQT